MTGSALLLWQAVITHSTTWPGAGVSDLSCQLVWLTGVSDMYNKFFVESFARSFGGPTTPKEAKSGPDAATGSLLAYRDLLRNLSRLLSASGRVICFECTDRSTRLYSHFPDETSNQVRQRRRSTSTSPLIKGGIFIGKRVASWKDVVMFESCF